MKIKHLIAKIALVLLLTSLTLPMWPKPARAVPIKDWLDDVVVEIKEAEKGSTYQNFRIILKNATLISDIAFRLTVDNRTQRADDTVANETLRGFKLYDYNNLISCAGQRIGDYQTGEFFTANTTSIVRTYAVEKISNNEFKLVDSRPPGPGDFKKYNVEVFGKRECVILSEGTGEQTIYVKAKNFGTIEFAPSPTTPTEEKMTKLRKIDLLYEQWRDLITGNKNASPCIDPFLLPETPNCNNLLPNSRNKTNQFWTEELATAAAVRQTIEQVINILSSGLSGDPSSVSTIFYLTPEGEQRFNEIKTAMNEIAELIKELDQADVTNQEIKDAPVLKRYWNRSMDATSDDLNNPTVRAQKTFQSWNELKTKINAMNDLFEQGIDNLAGDKAGGVCMGTDGLKAEGQEINILGFIACLINMVADQILKLAVSWMATFAGI